MSVFRVILSVLFVASLACEPTAVEETGYLIAEDVGYSSEGPLDGDVNTDIRYEFSEAAFTVSLTSSGAHGFSITVAARRCSSTIRADCVSTTSISAFSRSPSLFPRRL